MKIRILILLAGLLALGLSVNSRAAETKKEEMAIRMTFADQSVIIVLDDHQAARDLVSMLPLTITFEDYNKIEKIGYLPRKLQCEGSPSSCDPETGTFAYYAPWGNLSIFYRDFRHSNGLVPLGHVVSGMDSLERMQGSFSVRLEREDSPRF